MSRSAKKRYTGVEQRITFVGVLIVLAFAVLGLRLWSLQVVHWSYYVNEAECNRLRAERLKAPRGMIFGRDESVVLADNRPSCDIMIVPAECGSDDIEEVCYRLSELLSIDASALLEAVSRSKKQPYRQILVKQDVSKNDLMRVEEFSYSLPGVFAVARPQRRYLYGKTAGQILGYLGRPTAAEVLFSNNDKRSDEELKEAKYDEETIKALRQLEARAKLGPPFDAREEYDRADFIGRSGLEQMYESEMRGADGQLVVNVYVTDRRPQLRTDASGKPYVGVDSYGRELEEEKEFRKEPSSGQSIFTTLDISLQQKCESLLEGEVGAIAVLEADTGAVLALASSPSYDPGVFVTHGRDRERSEALTSKPNPMRNRCYQEQYPPGSVFKIMLAAAGLEEGVITEKSRFSCGGSFGLPGVSRRWNCWRKQGHGGVEVIDALAFSCDVFFYNVGLKLGIDKIKEWSQKFSLGEMTGIDLPQEIGGWIPCTASKEERMRALKPDQPSEWRWYPGETVNVSIGQGGATTTPLQNAVMMAAIVNGGRKVRPYVNAAVGPHVSEPFMSERTLEIVRAGVRKCVAKDPPAPTGTGNAAKVAGMDVVGKTGTAQIVSLDKHKKYAREEDIPYHLRDHAWFVAGVLDREPKIAMCILVEHGAHGSSAAAPLAKDVIEHFYRNRNAEPPSLEEDAVAVEYATEPADAQEDE